ncbi:MAG TPA: LPS assembly lipoprotein LptE [Longimicrobiales bacterium]
MRRLLTAGALATALLCAGCGYGFAAGAGRFPAGAESVRVRPLANQTGDAEVGALVAAALRQELARRGLAGGESAPARIEGEVVASSFAPSTANGATYSQALEVRLRLMVGEKLVSQRSVRKQEDYLGGLDPLESEGRRRVALHRLAELIARDAVDQLESP